MPVEYLYGTNYRNLINLANPGNVIDGSLVTYGHVSDTGNGGSFGVPDYSGTPAWDSPSHQAEYDTLELCIRLTTVDFDETMTWELEYDLEGDDPHTEWRPPGSANLSGQTLRLDIPNPTTQVIDDIVGKITVTQAGGPPATWTLYVYEMWLEGTWADSEDVVELVGIESAATDVQKYVEDREELLGLLAVATDDLITPFENQGTAVGFWTEATDSYSVQVENVVVEVGMFADHTEVYTQKENVAQLIGVYTEATDGVVYGYWPATRVARGVRCRHTPHSCFIRPHMIDFGRRYAEHRGKYRVFNAAEYRFYRSDTAPPDEGDSPFATSASLPHTPTNIYADGIWYLSVSYFNGVLDSGFLPLGPNGETFLRLDISGAEESGSPPDGPATWHIEQRAGGVVGVVGFYMQGGHCGQRSGR